ncbi:MULTISPECIES: hypothetical protein [Flammeovirga]|uniref:Uncharacterized protein n=1 Tax=Flammeovirga agarivorans TaxID=2726742 RepID=A0A7X8SG70_9BACT|nr:MULTISPECIES: hypothetical protein [Flammeovirga]NLR89655.1 hypothetical protein [Flammeovirga agarivorans]
MVTISFKKKNNASHAVKKNYADQFEVALKNLELFTVEERERNKLELSKKFQGYI